MSKTNKLSPMMQQYEDAKAACNGAMLLFRMGDFYELFHEDAEVAAKVLGLNLTSRDRKSENPVPMAGFPHHQLDAYLAKLIKAGYRVAVCEQVETPAQAKGLVKREVTRVVSPGTITDHELLDPRQSNYLASIVYTTKKSKPGQTSMGVAWMDISTGDFVTCQIHPSQLSDILAKLMPAEILLAESSQQELPDYGCEPVQTRQADWVSTTKHARETLLRHFQVVTLDGFGVGDDQVVAIRAAGALLYYVQENQAQALDFIDHLVPWSPGQFMEIDQATWRSLEITRTIRNNQRQGSLFDVIDRTITSMGSRNLAHWLSQPLTCRASIVHRQQGVAELVQQNETRQQLRELLAGVYDIQRLLSRFATGRSNPRDLQSIGKTLQAMPGLKSILAQTKSEILGDLANQLGLCESLQTKLSAALQESCPLHTRDGGFIQSGFDAKLDEFRELASGGKQWIAAYQARVSEETKIPSIKVGYNKVFGYFLEVTNLHKDKVPAEFVRKQTLKNAERYITSELKEYEEKVLSAEQNAQELEMAIFTQLRESVGEHLAPLKSNAAIIACLDTIAALAELATTQNYVLPNIVDEPLLEIIEGRHPVLDMTQPLGAFVPNDTRMDGEHGLIHLITGPNMAGKSTYIRQTALIVLLAHVGSFVPATQATIGITDRLFARVGASDELSRGQSTFMVEMTETARILNTATPRSLIILDEIGRGTSTYDGVSLAWAIVEYLHDRIGSRTMFATHYHELTKLQDTLSAVTNYNVVVKEWNDEIVFLHRIELGAADKSYGIHVAKLAGVPKWVNDRAGKILNKLENQNSSNELQPLDNPSLATNQEIQLTLFGTAPHPLIEKIKRLDPDHVTPMGALELLNEWRQELKDPVDQDSLPAE